MRKGSKSFPNSLCVRKSGGKHENISTEMFCFRYKSKLEILSVLKAFSPIITLLFILIKQNLSSVGFQTNSVCIYLSFTCISKKYSSMCYKLNIVQPDSLLINLKFLYLIHDNNRKASKEKITEIVQSQIMLFCVSGLGVQPALNYKVDSSYQKSISKKLEKIVVWKNPGAMP